MGGRNDRFPDPDETMQQWLMLKFKQGDCLLPRPEQTDSQIEKKIRRLGEYGEVDENDRQLVHVKLPQGWYLELPKDKTNHSQLFLRGNLKNLIGVIYCHVDEESGKVQVFLTKLNPRR